MKIQNTYPFILLLMIIISFSSIMAIVWSLLLSANSIPFLLLLIIAIFIFVCVYISNNKINIDDIDKKTCVLSSFVIWLMLIVMGAIPFYILFPGENIKNIFFLTASLVSTNGAWSNIEIIDSSSFMIWQSILQWLGGLCTIVVASFFVEMVLSKKNISKDYFSLENFRIIFFLYSSLTIIFILIFTLLLNDLSEAIQISMALISTSMRLPQPGTLRLNSII